MGKAAPRGGTAASRRESARKILAKAPKVEAGSDREDGASSSDEERGPSRYIHMSASEGEEEEGEGSEVEVVQVESEEEEEDHGDTEDEDNEEHKEQAEEEEADESDEEAVVAKPKRAQRKRVVRDESEDDQELSEKPTPKKQRPAKTASGKQETKAVAKKEQPKEAKPKKGAVSKEGAQAESAKKQVQAKKTAPAKKPAANQQGAKKAAAEQSDGKDKPAKAEAAPKGSTGKKTMPETAVEEQQAVDREDAKEPAEPTDQPGQDPVETDKGKGAASEPEKTQETTNKGPPPTPPRPKLKVRAPAMGESSPSKSAKAVGEDVKYEVLLTLHEHGLETIRFVETIGDPDGDGTQRLLHTGYKKQKGTITEALTEQVEDETRRREKVQARTSKAPKYEDITDKDAWLFIRFVDMSCITKEFVDGEVKAMQARLDNARTVFKATALPKDYREQKIRESWCLPYVVRCTNKWAPHGTICLEPWDVALTNKDIARFTTGRGSVFPDEPLENVMQAGGFFSPGSPYSLQDLDSGGLPRVHLV